MLARFLLRSRGAHFVFIAALWLLAVAGPARAADEVTFRTEDYGMLFRGAHPRVLGLDGAFSMPIDEHRALWSFGDTLQGSLAPSGDRTITAMPSNTMAIVDDLDVLDGASHARFLHAAVPLLPLPLGKRRVWPLDLVTVGDRWWSYFVTIEATGTGPLDFKVVGTGVADARPGEAARFDHPKTLWPGEAPGFGASVLRVGDWLYVYAGGDKTHLARVPLTMLDKPDAYTYYAGPGRWVGDWRQAEALPASGAEMSVRWNTYLKSYVMIAVPGFGKTIEIRFAPAPEGPWSAARTLATCQPANDPQAMFYGAKQHVEMDVEGGKRIFVTYNTNAASELIAGRSDLYWPRLVRVSFEKPETPQAP